MASLTLFNSMIHIKSTTTPTVFCIHISDCKIEEKNGFLKYVCHENEDGTTVYKCTHPEEFYAPHQNFDALKIFYAYEICSNDPHFYQVCDKRLGGKITNDHVLCEYYLCDGRKQHGRTWTSIALSKLSKCFIHCNNTVLNKEGCNDEKVALPTGQLVRPRDICNDVCDLPNCEDEAICNGFLYGRYCMKQRQTYYAPPRYICDDWQDCDGREDEEDCTVVE